MKNIIQYVLSVSLSLLILIVLEGLFTMGQAFKFEQYGIVAWVFQVLITVFTISLAIIIVQNDIESAQKEKFRRF